MYSLVQTKLSERGGEGVSALRAFVTRIGGRPTPALRPGLLPVGPPGLRHCAALICALMLATGCAQQRYVTLRERPQNVLASSLGLIARTGPRPTPRTLQLLRRYALVPLAEQNPEIALTKL